jgi:hypothetical protein
VARAQPFLPALGAGAAARDASLAWALAPEEEFPAAVLFWSP